LTRPQTLAPEETAQARAEAIRDLAGLADDLTFLAEKNDLVHAAQYRRGLPRPDLPIG
jgi:hypothetical protein